MDLSAPASRHSRLRRLRVALPASAGCALACLAVLLCAGARPAAARDAGGPAGPTSAALDGARGALPAARAASGAPTYLWSLSARDGSTRRLAPRRFALTLRDVDRAVVQFTDRPWRKAYVLHVRDFVRDWDSWFASDDEPNAVLSYLLPGRRRPLTIVVELSRPRYAHGVLRFRARRLYCQHDPLPDATAPVAVRRPQTPSRFTGATLFVDGAGEALGTSTGDLVLFAGGYTPQCFLRADGSSLVIEEYEPLYVALCGAGQHPEESTFSLPSVAGGWPSGAFSGANGRWLVAPDAIFPISRGPQNCYPDQVYFTAISPTIYGSYFHDMASARVTDAGFGALLGTRARAYLMPSTWTWYSAFGQVDYGWLIGELRLFKSSVTLPKDWLPADGRWVAVQDWIALWSVLKGAYGADPDASTFPLPSVAAPDGYQWAIAGWGIFPAPQ